MYVCKCLHASQKREEMAVTDNVYLSVCVYTALKMVYNSNRGDHEPFSTTCQMIFIYVPTS